MILASGPEDGGKRATLALAAACTAQAMDLETIVFLLGDGAHWAYDGRAEQIHAPGFPALADLIDSFVEAGGQLLLCSACDAKLRTTERAAPRGARQWARLASVSHRRRQRGDVLNTGEIPSGRERDTDPNGIPALQVRHNRLIAGAANPA